LSCTKSGELHMATKKPRRIETFQILDLIVEIARLKYVLQEDEDDDEVIEQLEELNAKLVELLDRLVALQ